MHLYIKCFEYVFINVSMRFITLTIWQLRIQGPNAEFASLGGAK